MSETRTKTVLICGGRGWGHIALYLEGEMRAIRALQATVERDYLTQVMDELDEQLGPFTHVVHGAAKGADSFGGLWGAERGKAVIPVPADWDTHGKAAGPIRNQQMLDEHHPDVVIAFSGGRGTTDMLERAVKTDAIVIHFLRNLRARGWHPVRLR